MQDYKTEETQERHENELRPMIARALGISERELAGHSYERDNNQIRWLGEVPKGVTAQGGITEFEWPAE